MSKNSIFISGLNYNSKEEDIKALFSTAGDIEKINLPKYQDTNRLRGYCHITYKNANSVTEALKLNKTTLDSRYLNVEQSKGEKEKTITPLEELKKKINPNTLTIFVKNLPYDLKEDELGDFFSKCGKIKNVRFVYNSKQGHFKGFAYIDFFKNTSLFTAIKMNGTTFKNRTILVDVDEGQKKEGFRFKMNNDGNTKYNNEIVDLKKKKIKKDKKKNKFGKEKIKNLTTDNNIDNTKQFVKKIDNLNIF